MNDNSTTVRPNCKTSQNQQTSLRRYKLNNWSELIQDHF